MGIGLTTGTINRIKKGQSPSAETLALLHQVENASYRWLTEGFGPPFNTITLRTDEETADVLDNLLAERWTIHLLTAEGGGRALVLTQPRQRALKQDKTLDYTGVEIVNGVIGPQTLDRIARAGGAGYTLAHIELDEETLQRLASGHMDNPALFGLLQHYPASTAGEYDRVAEEIAHYRDAKEGGADLSPAERELLERYRSLPPEDQRRLQAVSSAFRAEVSAEKDKSGS